MSELTTAIIYEKYVGKNLQFYSFNKPYLIFEFEDPWIRIEAHVNSENLGQIVGPTLKIPSLEEITTNSLIEKAIVMNKASNPPLTLNLKGNWKKFLYGDNL